MRRSKLEFRKKKKRMFGRFVCEDCQEILWRNSPSQRFCGSLKRKEGCSYKHHIDVSSIYTPARKVYSKKRYQQMKTHLGRAPYKWATPV